MPISAMMDVTFFEEIFAYQYLYVDSDSINIHK